MSELLSPLKTIRQHCLECGGTIEERKIIRQKLSLKKTSVNSDEIFEGMRDSGSFARAASPFAPR